MAYDPGALEATLAAVAGAQPELIAELRAAYFESAEAILTTIRNASDDAGWTEAAARLRSLSASFGLRRVMDVAAEAAAAPCGDARALRRIERAIGAIPR